MPLRGTNGVAETIVDVAVAETDGEVEASSRTVVEAAFVVLVEATSVVLESSCRGRGRATPAKTTLRHKNRAKRAHRRWDTTVVLILLQAGVKMELCLQRGLRNS